MMLKLQQFITKILKISLFSMFSVVFAHSQNFDADLNKKIANLTRTFKNTSSLEAKFNGIEDLLTWVDSLDLNSKYVTYSTKTSGFNWQIRFFNYLEEFLANLILQDTDKKLPFQNLAKKLEAVTKKIGKQAEGFKIKYKDLMLQNVELSSETSVVTDERLKDLPEEIIKLLAEFSELFEAKKSLKKENKFLENSFKECYDVLTNALNEAISTQKAENKFLQNKIKKLKEHIDSLVDKLAPAINL